MIPLRTGVSHQSREKIEKAVVLYS